MYSRKFRLFGGLIVLVVMAFFAAACVPPLPPPPPPPPPTTDCSAKEDIRDEIFNLLNATRVANGLPELAWANKLACLATNWSEYMAINNLFTHQNLIAVIIDPNYEEYRCLGENIAKANDSASAQNIHDAWMVSPSHKANMLSSGYIYVGIGIYYLDGKIWVTENFAC